MNQGNNLPISPDDHKIHKAFEDKTWTDLKGENSWSIFKVMAEFVDGFDKLTKIGPCVSIFGSARTKPTDSYYQVARKIAAGLVDNGFGVITGGGPGIMEAGNKGAFEARGKSVGLCITLPHEETNNKYIDRDKFMEFDYFFVRKTMFTKYSQGFVVMPGGFGTMDELFEALTLIQTKKIARFPIVLVGKKFWGGLIDWIKGVMLEQSENISPEDMFLFSVVDTADEAVNVICEYYSKYRITPNF